ncbi:hypothetical protein [Jatrophihabitans sp.]|uniref:hypothetical protein n=1 Tax=Jatrophihabitans sp. TaxID=1932789 RepID=UPI0030C76D9D|nr:hypothetical protein [Jatrophihabitans sp.]
MRYVIIGQIGSDAGYWSFENGHLVHHEGWGVDSIREVQAALSLISEVAKLRTPGLAEKVTAVLDEFVGAELAEHVGGERGTVIVAA